MCLRFRCDVVPNASAQCRNAWGHSSAADIDEELALRLCQCSGVVGVGRVYVGKTLEDLTDEAAEQIAEDVVDVIRQFCTPLVGNFSDQLFQKMLNAARTLAVDGALLKAARVLRKKKMPGVILICRDASHAIRIACKEPLARVGGFEEQHKRLFKDRDALLKIVDFSNKIKAQLEQCQKYVVSMGGSQGGGLKTIMCNFSHSPIRWESMAAPQCAYCCMLGAVAMLLALLVDTERDSKRRRVAKEALEAMTSQNIYRTALSGDFNEVGLVALRLWDVLNSDPAKEVADVENLKSQLQHLFLEGNVLSEAPAETRGGVTARTVLQIAHEQLRGGMKVHYGDRLHVIHAGDLKKTLIEAMAEMAVATEATLDRMDVEFWKGDLRASLRLFDLSQYTLDMLRLYSKTPEEGGEVRKQLLVLLVLWQRLGRALNIDVRPDDVIIVVRGGLVQRRELKASSAPGSEHVPDNRACWLRAVVRAFAEQKHVSSFTRLHDMLQYFSHLRRGRTIANEVSGGTRGIEMLIAARKRESHLGRQ